MALATDDPNGWHISSAWICCRDAAETDLRPIHRENYNTREHTFENSIPGTLESSSCVLSADRPKVGDLWGPEGLGRGQALREQLC